jgi:hypothetical protein
MDKTSQVLKPGLYKSKTIETILEFTLNIKDAIEISVKIH